MKAVSPIMKPERVTVFHQGALGDFLLALRAVDEICEAQPALRVNFWSRSEHLKLAACKRWFLGGHLLDGPLIPSLLHDELWQSAALPGFLLASGRVLIFGQTGTRILAQRLAARLGARVDWVRSFPSEGEGTEHVADWLRGRLTALGWPLEQASSPLIVPPGGLDPLRDLPVFHGNSVRPAVVHPGSGGRRKIWPLRNWRSLVTWLRNGLSLPVIVSIGPDDECLEGFSREMRDAGISVVGGLPLVQMASLLAQSRVYVGSDSGVTHLAAAVGAPVVAVFGPTDPRVWGPRGENARTVRRNWHESELFETGAVSDPPDPELVESISGLVARS